MPGPAVTVSDLVLDCSTLFHIPVQTGIQRVVRRLIRHWPGNPRLHVARFDPDHGLVRVSDAALAILLESGTAAFGAATERLHARLARASPAEQPALPDDAPVLLPEVFFEPQRVAFYRAAVRDRTRTVAMLAYDFMPYLHSGLINAPSVVPLMPYLRLMTEARNLAFISERTREEYVSRIVRRSGPSAEAGPVFHLGADGLPVAPQRWDPARRAYACIGTVTRRKNQHLVAEAFRALWAAGSDARLVLVGHDMEEVPTPWLLDMLSHPNFTWLNAVSDAEAGAVLDTARATVFASEVEGFGIPPLESLAAGVPVIASGGLPSLAPLPVLGQVRLDAVTPATIREAVEALEDDAVAARLWAEAAELSLPGWADFARNVAAWTAELPPPDLAAATRIPGPGG